MVSEINTIIFSKNRACQLELLLRTWASSATVLYTFEPEFGAGYEKLIGMYPSVKFVREINFKTQLLEIINGGSEYLMFLVDDDIVIEPFSEDCSEFAEFKINPDIICLTLRMSPAYLYRGLPVLENNKWKWEQYRRGGEAYNYHMRNWGYPMSASSHVFRKMDILPIISSKEIRTPNYLEGAMNTSDAVLPNRPLMMCFDKAKIINNMANQVQTDFPCGTSGVSLTELEERFLKGERLSLQDIKGKVGGARTCFLKTNYEFVPADNNSETL